MSELYIKVALPLPLRKIFDYRVPEEMKEKIEKGKRVSVPFKNYELKGFIVDFYEGELRAEIKEINRIIDEKAIINENILNLCHFLSEEYFLPIGQILRIALSPSLEIGKTRRVRREISERITIPEIDGNFSMEILKRLKRKKPFVISAERKTRYLIYIELAKKMKEKGKRVIIVFPEILKANFFHKIEKGDLSQALIHSEVSKAKRVKEIERVIAGEADLIIGTMTVLFLPVKDLSLVIMDEEESRYYKMEENPRLHGILVGKKRAEIENSNLILGVLSPSVETYLKISKKEYDFLKIPERKRVDLKMVKEKSLFPQELTKELKRNLKEGNPSFILTVRKGMGGILLCKKCSWFSLCPKCKIPLKTHEEGEQVCHICGLKEPLKLFCPKCNHKLSFIGGVGTERISQVVREFFPKVKVGILDLEKARTRKFQKRVWGNFSSKKIDILIGTQLLFTSSEKPYERTKFLALIKPEVNLSLPDMNFSEETFHLLNSAIEMVEDGGKVFVNTEFPEHHSIKWLEERNTEIFYKEEIKIREMMRYPPFGRVVKIILSRKTLKGVGRISRSLFKEIREKITNIEILGPYVTPHGGKKRAVQILIKGDGDSVKKWLKENITVIEKHGAELDLDPISIF